MHQHQVYDTDNHFVIDPITKEIINRSEKMKLMQGDHNSERFTFEIPRYIDGHDMTLCDKIEVHYINIDSKTKESNKDVYLVDDMQLSPNGEDVVVFSWLISSNATKLAGTLNFRITFKCISEPSIIDYQMSTEIFKGITVSDGISNGEAVIEEYSDVLEQWKQELNLAGEYAQQIEQNASEIDELQAGLSESRNYVNEIINYEIKWNDGGYISKDDGSVNDETGSSYSDFVAVRPGTKLIITNTMTTENGYNAFYDPNDTFLSSFSNAAGEVVVPDGAVKMRLSKYSTATLSVASNVKTYIDDSIEKVEANAKLTDDAVNELKNDLVDLENKSIISLNGQKYTCSYISIAPGSSHRTENIKIPNNSKVNIILKSFSSSGSAGWGAVNLTFFNKNNDEYQNIELVQDTMYYSFISTQSYDYIGVFPFANGDTCTLEIEINIESIEQRMNTLYGESVLFVNEHIRNGYVYSNYTFYDDIGDLAKCIKMNKSEFEALGKVKVSGRITGFDKSVPLYTLFNSQMVAVRAYSDSAMGTEFDKKEITISPRLSWEYIVINLGSDWNSFRLYGEKQLAINYNNLSTIKPNYGDTIVNFGDSIFGRWRGNSSISKMIENYTGAEVINCALSGSTMARLDQKAYNPQSEFSLCALVDAIVTGDYSTQDNLLGDDGGSFGIEYLNTINLLKTIDFSKVDIITISLGTNDFGTDVPIAIGDNPTSKNAYKSAYRYTIERLLTAFPNIRIIMCTPLWRGDMEVNHVPHELYKYADAVKDVAKDYLINVCDFYYEMSVSSINKKSMFGDQTDLVHPNCYGRKRMANKLSSIIVGM